MVNTNTLQISLSNLGTVKHGGTLGNDYNRFLIVLENFIHNTTNKNTLDSIINAQVTPYYLTIKHYHISDNGTVKIEFKTK